MSLVRTRENLHKMQWLLIGFFIIFAASIFFQLNPFSAQSGNGPGSAATTLARINGQEVAKSAFDQRVNQYRTFMARGQAIPMEQQASLPQYAWDSILSEYAQAAAAEANGVKVSDSEVQAEADRMIDQRVEELGAGSTAAEKDEIRSQISGMIDTDGQRRSMLSQRLREKLGKDARPVEVKVAHVLIKNDTRTPAQAERMARDIGRRAKAGEDIGRLASQFSEDMGSKMSGGIAGWAGAIPPPPADPKAKKNPDEVGSFVPEFTAAALRLKRGEVSEPVLSTYGWHVLKVVDERPYKPAPEKPVKGAKPDPKADAKKAEQALEDYKKQAGDKIAQGLFEEYKNRAKVEAVAPWLQGYLAEQDSSKNMMASVKSGKIPSPGDRLQPAIKAYSAALSQGGAESGPPLAYKLAKLHQEAGQNQQALDTLNGYQGRDPDIEVMRGDLLEKLGKKTDAVAAYQSAGKLAYANPSIHGQLADKLKKLGRNDLAEAARKEQAKQLAQQAADEKARQQQQAMQMAEFERKQKEQAATDKAAKDKAAKDKTAPGASGAAGASNTATATTGSAPAANAPAANAPASNAPASNAPAANAPK